MEGVCADSVRERGRLSAGSAVRFRLDSHNINGRYQTWQAWFAFHADINCPDILARLKPGILTEVAVSAKRGHWPNCVWLPAILQDYGIAPGKPQLGWFSENVIWSTR